MPTTYTHDLFGKRVYQRLPGEMKELIHKYGNLYRIGLHGPDILFYFLLSKNPVSRYGVKMHHEKAEAFFEKGMDLARRLDSAPLTAYMLGFGCHYLLDSTCHPYVNRMAAEKVISHTLLEKEFDRSLMLETGKDPAHFYPSDCIVPRWSYARVIHRAIPEISAVNIYISLRMMKWITNAMVPDDDGRRRRFVGRLTGLAGKENQTAVLDHFMTPEPSPKSTEPLKELHKLFEEALAEAPEYLAQLYRLRNGSGKLGLRWNRTYNG